MGNIFYSAGKSKKLNLLTKLEVDLYFKAFKLLLFFSELYLPFNKGNELNWNSSQVKPKFRLSWKKS